MGVMIGTQNLKITPEILSLISEIDDTIKDLRVRKEVISYLLYSFCVHLNGPGVMEANRTRSLNCSLRMSLSGILKCQ